MGWFASAPVLTRFLGLVRRTYNSVLQCTEIAGLATGDSRHAVLLTVLVRRMLSYQDETLLAGLDPDLKAELEREIEAVWKVLKHELDQALAEAREMVDAPEEEGSLQ